MYVYICIYMCIFCIRACLHTHAHLHNVCAHRHGFLCEIICSYMHEGMCAVTVVFPHVYVCIFMNVYMREHTSPFARVSRGGPGVCCRVSAELHKATRFLDHARRPSFPVILKHIFQKNETHLR